MNKIVIGLLLMVFFLGDLSAQKEDFIWEFGANTNEFYGTELDFNTQPVTVRARNYAENFYIFNKTCSGISSPEGQLLFYTHGIFLYDRRHRIMQNGDSLHLTDYTQLKIEHWNGEDGLELKQNMLILPWPERDSLYFMMHHSVSLNSHIYRNIDLLYSTVDMTKNNGYGRVMLKNEHLITDTLACGRLTANRHANGRDWWILVRRAYGSKADEYHRYLLEPEGIRYIGRQSIGETVPFGDGRGQAAFSPNGEKYAFLTYYTGQYPYQLDVYDFDRCTGLLSNPVRLVYNSETDEPVSGFGLSFSPNSRYLYASTKNKIRQYDLQASDVGESEQIVGEMGDRDCFGFDCIFSNMQLAPDGKIYIAGHHFSNFGEIRYPDQADSACRVIPASLELLTYNKDAIPDFPVYRLGPLDGSSCDTLGIERPPVARFRDDQAMDQNPYTVRCTDISWYQPLEWQWSFGDGQTDTVQHPEHTYADTGTYELCLTVVNEDGEDTHCDTVHIEDEATGVNDPRDDDSELTVYPIPSTDYVTIKGLKHGSVLRIYDNRGQIVDRKEITAHKINYRISSLEPGIYWIRTIEHTTKFIKQ